MTRFTTRAPRRVPRHRAIGAAPAVLAAAVLVIALVAGCTSGAGSAAAGSAAAAPAAAHDSGGPPATIAGYYAQRLAWTPCDNGFECARLYVPFDYARPAGPRFSLPVVKLPAADPARRIGALVVNPGGPGASGVSYALGARSGEFSQAILNRFDIVGFDPRGVGGSQPALRCMTGPQLDRYFAVNEAPTTAAQLAAVESANRFFEQQCARNAAALLPHVGTANTARDMDVLRSALGLSRLDYLGKSYGTVLGASYARQFPGRVRALVLDGAVAPGLSGLNMDITQAEGFESAFGQFASWCVTQSGCPFAGSGSGAVAQATSQVAALLARANSRPLASQLTTAQPADGAMLLLGIAAALYSRTSWPVLKAALSQALGGDGTILVELADDLEERAPNGTYSNMTDVETAVDCIDSPWPRSMAAWRSAASQAAKAAPLFGPTLVWSSLACAYWPVKPSPVLAGATASAAPGPAASRPGTSAGAPSASASPGSSAPGTSPPVLVVGDLHDPATPYAWAKALARWLPSGVLLGWNGEGHTSYMEGSSCVDSAVDTYLITGAAPRNGTVCP